MGGCSRTSAFPPSSRGATRRPPPGSMGSLGPPPLKAPPAEIRSATALPEVVARARAGRAGFARAPNLPLRPPCGHSHAAIRLWFGRKVEVSVCVTSVSGVDLSISMERSMHAVTRTIALVLVMLGLGSAPLWAQANPPPAQANPPPPSGPTPQGPQYSSNEIVDAGHRFFGTISRGLAQIVEKTDSQ